MGKIGKTCCKCIHPCGNYCILSNPATTTLQISGPHAATLVIPITYEVTNDENLLNLNCMIEGRAFVDHSESVNSVETECRYIKSVAFDGISVKIEKCCDPNWETIFDGSIESFIKNSVTSYAQHKYVESRVKIRAGTKIIDGEPVCGVYVNVCLIFARLHSYIEYSCGRTTTTGMARNITTQVDASCCAESDEMVAFDEEEVFNSDPEESGCSTSAAFDDTSFLNIPPCPTEDQFADMEPEILTQYLYQTNRQVFIPNSDSVGCDPFQVVLTPDDIFSESCGYPEDPDPVYWMWDDCSFYDEDPRVPAPTVVETLCGSNSTSALHFGVFWEFCDTATVIGNNDRNILQPVDIPAFCATDVLTVQGFMDNGNYKKTVNSRSRGYLVETDIVDGEVMFDELSTTWTLTIGSVNCPPL